MKRQTKRSSRRRNNRKLSFEFLSPRLLMAADTCAVCETMADETIAAAVPAEVADGVTYDSTAEVSDGVDTDLDLQEFASPAEQAVEEAPLSQEIEDIIDVLTQPAEIGSELDSLYSIPTGVGDTDDAGSLVNSIDLGTGAAASDGPSLGVSGIASADGKDTVVEGGLKDLVAGQENSQTESATEPNSGVAGTVEQNPLNESASESSPVLDPALFPHGIAPWDRAEEDSTPPEGDTPAEPESPLVPWTVDPHGEPESDPDFVPDAYQPDLSDEEAPRGENQINPGSEGGQPGTTAPSLEVDQDDLVTNPRPYQTGGSVGALPDKAIPLPESPDQVNPTNPA